MKNLQENRKESEKAFQEALVRLNLSSKEKLSTDDYLNLVHTTKKIILERSPEPTSKKLFKSDKKIAAKALNHLVANTISGKFDPDMLLEILRELPEKSLVKIIKNKS